MENIYFFTGENDFQLTHDLTAWRSAFCEKHGAENLSILDGRTEKFNTILDAVSAMPFLAEKRLVILKGVPKVEKTDIEHLFASVHPDVIFALVDPKPDKRLAAVKYARSNATLKEYPALQPKDVRTWLENRAKQYGLDMQAPVVSALLQMCGTNMWILDQECKKLSLATNGTPTKEDILLLVQPSGEQMIFGLTNLLSEGKVEDALSFVKHQIERGEDPFSMWAVLLDMIRKTALVWAGINEGKSQQAVASECKMHPFAVRSMMPLVQKLSVDDVRSLVHMASTYDQGLKTGVYRYAADAPEELLAMLTQLIVRCRPRQSQMA